MEDLANDLIEVVMMIRRTKMRLEVVVKTKGEIIPIITMIKTIEIKEEKAKDKDLDEEASMGNVFTTEKKGIKHLNVLVPRKDRSKNKWLG